MKTIRTFFALAEKKIVVSSYNEIMQQHIKNDITFKVSATIDLDCDLNNVYEELQNHWYFKQSFAELEQQYANIVDYGSIFLSNINLLGVEHD